MDYSAIPGFLQREKSTVGDDKLRVKPSHESIKQVEKFMQKFREQREKHKKDKAASDEAPKEDGHVEEHEDEHHEDEQHVEAAKEEEKKVDEVEQAEPSEPVIQETKPVEEPSHDV